MLRLSVRGIVETGGEKLDEEEERREKSVERGES